MSVLDDKVDIVPSYGKFAREYQGSDLIDLELLRPSAITLGRSLYPSFNFSRCAAFLVERLTDKRAASCIESDLIDSSFQTLAKYLYR
jgi:hypothetical protein